MPESRLTFWDGLSCYRLGYFMSRCKDEIIALFNGQTRELHLDLKVFSEHKIYSIRLNRADRLLFTVIHAEDGKNYILFLEIIEGHKYQHSIYLKPHNLTHFLQNKAEEIYQFMDKESFYSRYIRVDLTPVQQEAASVVPIHFSASQVEEDYTYPIFVNGSPGSGKTTWLVQQLEKEIAKTDFQELKKILYLTSGPATLREHCVSHLGEEALVNVCFLTYPQVLEACFQVPAVKLATHEHFDDWYNSYCHLPKNRKFFKTVNSEKVRQEFFIIAANESGYLALGARACLFQSLEERNSIVQAYKAYAKFLHEKEMMCPYLFYADIKAPMYDFVFVDDAQGLSPNAIKLLLMLSQKVHFAIAFDNDQSKWSKMDSYIQHLLKNRIGELKLKDEVTTISLAKTYRCSKKVVEFSTKILDMKERLLGKHDKHSVKWVEQMPEGKVLWESFYPETADDFSRYIALLQRQAQVSQEEIVLVVPTVLKEDFETLDVLRMTPHLRVCTPYEAKELEYAVVIYWRPFDNSPVYAQINKFLLQWQDSAHHKQISLEELAPVMGDLYGVSMRAKNFLVFMQPDNHACHHLVNYLKNNLLSLSEEKMMQSGMSLAPVKTYGGNNRNRLFVEAESYCIPSMSLRLVHTA